MGGFFAVIGNGKIAGHPEKPDEGGVVVRAHIPHAGHEPFVIPFVKLEGHGALLHLGNAGDAQSGRPCPVQRGQKHSRQNGDDGDDHQKFDQSKYTFFRPFPFHFPLLFRRSSFPNVRICGYIILGDAFFSRGRGVFPGKIGPTDEGFSLPETKKDPEKPDPKKPFSAFFREDADRRCVPERTPQAGRRRQEA